MNNYLMVPLLMRLLRFHGSLTVNRIKSYTGLGSSSIRYVLNSLVDSGLLVKGGDPLKYSLSDNSDYWPGWHRF